MKTLSIKAILFIVMLLLVLSCQKEDTHEHLISELEPKKQKLSNVSSKDIPEVMNFLRQGGKTQLDFAIHRSSSNVNKSGNEDLVLTTVELDNIKKLTNSQGLSNYSFQLRFDNHQNLNGYTSIFNLVVKELSTGEHYSYIQDFRIENAWLLSNNLQTDMPSYTGFMVFYNTEGEFLINLELSNGTLVNYEETGKCDGSQDGSGSNSGGGGSAEGGPGPGGSTPGTGGPGGGFGGPGLPFGWYCFHRGSYHAMPGDCNAEWEGGYWVIDKSLILKEKGEKLLKNGCVAAPEECFNNEQDPCECDADGQCVEENDEVPINDGSQINLLLVTELNSLLDEDLLPTQVQAMGYYGDELFQQKIDFLNENSTIEAQNFIHAVAETIEEVGSEGTVEVDFEVLENFQFFNEILEYYEGNDEYNEKILDEAILTFYTNFIDPPWTINSGLYNNIPSLEYTASRSFTYRGVPVTQFRLVNGDVISQGDYGPFESDFRIFYNIKGTTEWFEMQDPSNYQNLSLDFIFNSFWSDVATPFARYFTPLEDVIILIDGKNFEGVAESRATAGLFVLVDLVPGGKVLKITRKAGHTLSAASPVIKIAIDATTKAQLNLKNQWKNVIANATNARKGNFGEICTDIDFVEKGYEVVHVNRHTTIDPIGDNTGIDHIFKNPVSGEYVIVESKFHGLGGLAPADPNTGLARQMSDEWIRGSNPAVLDSNNRLFKALGHNAILYNQVVNNYQRVIGYIQANGTINYKYVSESGFEINTIFNN